MLAYRDHALPSQKSARASAQARGHVLDWLLSSLEVEATVFHHGQYCGAFRASTTGFARATFHLVLRGRCFLHRPGLASLELRAGDAVFLLRDVPHALTPEPTLRWQGEPLRHGEMVAVGPSAEESVALVCGFFDFRAGLSQLIAAALPDTLFVRGGDPRTESIRRVVELFVEEGLASQAGCSSLLERLASVLFLYVVRHLAERNGGDLQPDLGLLHAARHDELTRVIEHLVQEPERAWSLAEMARVAGMSRATFAKRFHDVTHCSPMSFLTALRMQLATRLLREGESVERTAERVGYHSTAAFARAFQRMAGQQPGAYRRAAREGGSQDR